MRYSVLLNNRATPLANRIERGGCPARTIEFANGGNAAGIIAMSPQ
jgi:hypothetical protein